MICKEKTVETKKIVEPTKTPIEFAEEHRVHGNNAFRTNNYEEAIDAYTKSIQYVDNNNVLYMNRALACMSLMIKIIFPAS